MIKGKLLGIWVIFFLFSFSLAFTGCILQGAGRLWSHLR